MNRAGQVGPSANKASIDVVIPELAVCIRLQELGIIDGNGTLPKDFSPNEFLSASVQILAGIGPAGKVILEAAGLKEVRDILTLPSRKVVRPGQKPGDELLVPESIGKRFAGVVRRAHVAISRELAAHGLPVPTSGEQWVQHAARS